MKLTRVLPLREPVIAAAVALISALTGVHAQAQSSSLGSPTFSDPTCSIQADKAFELPARFSNASKALAGKCLDTAHYRPVTELTVNGKDVSFANYKYKGQYWKAQLSLEPGSIEAVYFQIKRFKIIQGVEAAHTEVRYKLASGHTIKLTNQTTGETAENNDILVSFEGGLDPGGKYNFAYGAFYNYALIGKVGDTQSMLAEKEIVPIEQYELNLSAEDRVQLLTSQLQRSQAAGEKTFYNTLRPNCTTEIFDRLDELARVKGQAPRFLTVISNDPVAGPSLEALQNRGLLKRRVQDFADEVKGQMAELPIPLREKKLSAVFPSVQGKPWSLVVVTPNTSALSDLEKQAISSLRTELIARSMQIMTGYASSVMLKGAEGVSGSELFSKMIADLQGEIQGLMKKMDAQMPLQPQTLGVYVVPMSADAEKLSLEKVGIDAAIPFHVQNSVVSIDDTHSQSILYWIGSGAADAAEVGSKASVPAYFMASAIVVNAKKGESVVTSQALIGINSLEKPFSSANDQVVLDTVKLPGGTSRTDRAALLITLRQGLNEPLNKTALMEFGPLGGLAGSMDASRFATLQLSKPLGYLGENCQVRANSVPNLTGVFGEKASGISAVDALLKGKAVAFQVLSAQLNLQTLAVDDMDINVATWPIKCLANDMVDQKFRDQANDTIKQFKEKLKAPGKGQMIFKLLETATNR